MSFIKEWLKQIAVAIVTLAVASVLMIGAVEVIEDYGGWGILAVGVSLVLIVTFITTALGRV